MSETDHVYLHRVLYGDTDQMGVVYYANYLRFFEGARNEWIRDLGLAYREIEERGIMMPVLDVQVSYQRSARYDDVLEIITRVRHTRVRIRFEYEVRVQGQSELICTGHSIHACVNKEGRPTRAPEWLLQALEPKSQRTRSFETPIEPADAIAGVGSKTES